MERVIKLVIAPILLSIFFGGLIPFLRVMPVYADSTCFLPISRGGQGGRVDLGIDTNGKTLPSNGDQLNAIVTLTNGCDYPTGNGDTVFVQWFLDPGGTSYFTDNNSDGDGVLWSTRLTISGNIPVGGQQSFMFLEWVKSGTSCATSGNVFASAGVYTSAEGPVAVTQNATSTGRGLGAYFTTQIDKSDARGSYLTDATVRVSPDDYAGEYGASGGVLPSANSGNYYVFRGLICLDNHTLSATSPDGYSGSTTLTGTNTAGEGADLCNADTRYKPLTISPPITPPPTPPPTPTPCTPGDYIDPRPCTSTPCGGDFCAQEIWQCRADGSDYDLVGSECSWDKDRCGTCGGGPTPPPETPTPTPGCTENCGCGYADLGCNQFVSRDGTDGSWTKDPLYVAGGDTVYFKMEINNFKDSIDWFALRNYFDDSFDGYPSMCQNILSDEKCGDRGSYPPYLYKQDPSRLDYDVWYDEYGGFDTGTVKEIVWSEPLLSNAQTFKNRGFAAYTGYTGGCGNYPAGWRRCWQDPESGGLTCLKYPDGCGTTWKNCYYEISFECNIVTVSTTYPVSGWVKDSPGGSGVGNVEISIYDNDRGETRTTTTNNSGYWEISGFVRPEDYYAVRVTRALNGYALPPKTSTSGWTWNTWTRLDTPLGSLSYESQQAGNNDCAGKDGSGVAGRCNFEFYNPYGYFDGANCSQFTGWTCDADSYSTALRVDFWTFNAKGEGIPIGSATANVGREPGVAAACGNNPNHGFVYSLPADSFLRDGAFRNIYAYGINTGGGRANTLLTNSPKIINCPAPTCQVSGVTCGAVTPSTVTLNNISLTDNGWGATGMAVQRDIWNLFTVPFASSFTDSGLPPNTTNYYYVGCSKDLGGGATAYTGWTGPVACTTSSPPPSCSSVSLSPNPMALFVEQATGRTLTPTVNDLRNGSISNLTYFSSNNGVATVNSPSSTSPFYQTTVNPNARGSTTINTRANLSGPGGTGSCTGTSTVSVGGCSVSLSASSVVNPNPVTISYNGRSPNSGTEPVRLWLKSQDRGEIWPGRGNDIMLNECNSVNGSTCSGSTTLQDLPAGDYYVHCDIPNIPDRCTGNPFCTYEGKGGADPCSGWVSCSTNDNAALAVADPTPTCTGVTLSPDPMPLFPEQTTGRDLTPTVSGIRYGRVSSVDYLSSDTRMATVTTPSTVSPFETTVGTPGLRGSPTVTATANLIGGAGLTGSCTGTSSVSVGGCDVSLSASSVVYPNSVTVSYSGRSPNLGTEPVRLWLKSQDGREIWPGRGNDIMLNECNSVNGSTCSGSTTLSDLPAGDYYVHCDIPNIPDRCTGNPFCTYEGKGGADPCSGWVSCSTNDNAALAVWGRPTCNINGPSTIYLDAVDSFSGSSTVLGGGISNMEIDRNRSQSVTGSDFAQLEPGYTTCGNISNTCAIPRATWEPGASDVGNWWVFCRGYNASSPPPYLECRPFGPYGYPSDSLVGDCGPNGEQDIISVNVEPPPSWFQTAGGDVHARGNLESLVSPQAAPPYFSLLQDGYPGVISAGSADLGPLPSPVSELGWLLDDYSYDGVDYFNRKPYGYEYFDKKIINTTNPDSNSDGILNQGELMRLNGNYKTAGSLTLERDWLVNGNKQVVILVNGDLTIKGKIQIQSDERNFVALIVRGNIMIDGSVSVDNLTNPPALEGVYIADGQIRTGSTGPSDKQLYARGAFIAWDGGFLLERTFQSTESPFEPAERFEHDINLLMQAPSALLSAPVVWQEIAP